jgi:hypothetical protein
MCLPSIPLPPPSPVPLCFLFFFLFLFSLSSHLIFHLISIISYVFINHNTSHRFTQYKMYNSNYHKVHNFTRFTTLRFDSPSPNKSQEIGFTDPMVTRTRRRKITHLTGTSYNQRRPPGRAGCRPRAGRPPYAGLQGRRAGRRSPSPHSETAPGSASVPSYRQVGLAKVGLRVVLQAGPANGAAAPAAALAPAMAPAPPCTEEKGSGEEIK